MHSTCPTVRNTLTAETEMKIGIQSQYPFARRAASRRQCLRQ